MNFQNYLKISAAEINQELDNFFKKWNEEVLACSSKLSDLNKSFIQANSGGKRLRGVFVKLGYELVGGISTSEILKPAAAFEIFQTAILAHDDVIDKSETRRGKPTLYKELGGNHYGISQTICLGDIGFFLAYRLIAGSNFPEKEKNQAISYFTNSIIQTVLGEILDVEAPQSGKADEETYLKICQLKTAYYTLTGPLQLGAVLAGADKKLLNNIEAFGEKLGTAFQIQDDILGVFGDEKTLGKSVTSDIEEGKNTLLVIYALQNASAKQNEILGKYYGKGKIGGSELEQIKKVFIDTGALKYSQQKAGGLVKEAKKIILQITENNELKTILEEMAKFLVKRNK